jgi:hypothetical protein
MPPGSRAPGNWVLTAELRQAIVWLVAGTINHHILDTCQGGDDCEGCCPECCGPCATLAWFRDEANDKLTRWLNEVDPGASWCWQLPDGSIDWAAIEAHWNPEKLGCDWHHEA